VFAKLSPLNIIKSHFLSLRNYETGRLSRGEIALHFGLPALLAGVHVVLVPEVSENVVSIIVSAASIVAGLMLNLLVLIYTLVFNAKSNPSPMVDITLFKKVSRESLDTIAFSILLCLMLVVASFLILSRFPSVALVGRFCTVYLGIAVIFCLLIVLKRCYIIVQQEMK